MTETPTYRLAAVVVDLRDIALTDAGRTDAQRIDKIAWKAQLDVLLERGIDLRDAVITVVGHALDPDTRSANRCSHPDALLTATAAGKPIPKPRRTGRDRSGYGHRPTPPAWVCDLIPSPMPHWFREYDAAITDGKTPDQAYETATQTIRERTSR